MEFLVLVHNRPPPPAAPITDYGFAELLTIIIVYALNYEFLCVFQKVFSLFGAVEWAVRCRPVLVISGNKDQTVVGKRMITAIAEMCGR